MRAGSSSSGTSSKASTSTSPRSVIFSDGITDSARNDSVMNGAPISTPCSASRSCRCSSPSATSSSGRSESSPAIGSASSPRDLAVARHDEPAAELLRPRGAQRHVASDTPTTTRLCASWATVEANAPARSPNPRTSPSPTRPVAVMALDHRDLGQVARRVGDHVPVTIGGSAGPRR